MLLSMHSDSQVPLRNERYSVNTVLLKCTASEFGCARLCITP